MSAGHQRLEVRDLRLRVRLGWTAAERRTRQTVRIDFELRYPRPPRATRSDELADTICYGEVCAAFRAYAKSAEVRLIEKLADDLCRVARRIAGGRARVAVSVHKLRVPVPGLHGGAVYRTGDFAGTIS